MELDEALERISVIHRHIVRGQIFHGYRAMPTALSGVMAFVACAVQGIWLQDDTVGAIVLWICAAAISVGIVALEMVLRCKRSQSSLERDMTIGAAEQFIPTLAAGALLTFVLAQFASDQLWLLPGLWAIIFALGIFASRRMLPRAVSLAGAWYLITGLLCIALGHDGPFFPWWTMAMTFGPGQLLAAGILYWNLEREHARA